MKRVLGESSKSRGVDDGTAKISFLRSLLQSGIHPVAINVKTESEGTFSGRDGEARIGSAGLEKRRSRGDVAFAHCMKVVLEKQPEATTLCLVGEDHVDGVVRLMEGFGIRSIGVKLEKAAEEHAGLAEAAKSEIELVPDSASRTLKLRVRFDEEGIIGYSKEGLLPVVTRKSRAEAAPGDTATAPSPSPKAEPAQSRNADQGQGRK